jgi:release factor glutamine methyltransferase
MPASLNTVKSLREFIKNELAGLYPEREITSLTWILFEDIVGIPRSELNLDPLQSLDPELIQKVQDAVGQLKLHRPIQYILGFADFFGLRFKVTPEVLIPRPETEELVKWVINDNKDFTGRLLDIGTGSGCIAVSLKKNLPGAEVFATDISEPALEIAAWNAGQNEMDVAFVWDDIRNSVGAPGKPGLDIIVSNPPYIPYSERQSMDKNVTGFEPGKALFVPDNDLLRFYHVIAGFGKQYLRKNGLLYLEINEKSGAEVVGLLHEHGYDAVTLRKDINGKDRMVKAEI